MALNQSDILQHNNPNLAVVDSDFSKGGFRTAVASVNDLYALSGKTDEPSAAGQLKEFATIVYVSGETKYYVLTDVTNVGNASGWSEFQTGGGAGTLTGATNGLSLVNTGTTVSLGGDLTGNTEINGLGLHNLTLNNINDFQITPSGGSNVTFGIDESGLLFSFTGGSVSYNSNAGLVYGGDYTTTFLNESLVSKRYVDTIAAGLHPKTAVLVATTGETLSLSGLTTIDGVSLTSGDRVLAKNQSNDVENGIYVVSGGTWSRSTDFDGSPEGEVEQGALVPVISGDTNKSTQWILVTKDPVVDTSGLTFTLFSTGVYNAGTGISILGSTINVDGTSLAGNHLIWTGDTFNVVASGITEGFVTQDVFTGYTATTALELQDLQADIDYISGITDTKLNISTFTGYTASTSQTISGLQDDINYISGITDNQTADINYISGITDTKLNISTFTGYTASTSQTIGDIENDITYISGVTDTKLNISTFTGYTASTEAILDNALTGATNGLFTSGRNVVLGGTLTGDTVFSGGVFNYGGNYSSTFINRTLPDVDYVTGYTQSAVTSNSNVLTTFEVTGTTYSATTQSDFIGASGGTTIYLPSSPKEGQRIVVADIGGDALSDSITICSNTLQIVGGSSATINTDYGSITFIYNGTFWSTAAFIN